MAPIKLHLGNADLEREEKRVQNPALGKGNGQSKGSPSPLITDWHLGREDGGGSRQG